MKKKQITDRRLKVVNSCRQHNMLFFLTNISSSWLLVKRNDIVDPAIRLLSGGSEGHAPAPVHKGDGRKSLQKYKKEVISNRDEIFTKGDRNLAKSPKGNKDFLHLWHLMN